VLDLMKRGTSEAGVGLIKGLSSCAVYQWGAYGRENRRMSGGGEKHYSVL